MTGSGSSYMPKMQIINDLRDWLPSPINHIAFGIEWQGMTFGNVPLKADFTQFGSCASPLSVWYKTKFGSQNLATNFGVFF